MSGLSQLVAVVVAVVVAAEAASVLDKGETSSSR